MKPAEHGIRNEGSEFYIYTPSKTALRTFLHPLRAGFFHYEAGYRQERSSFDSFLIMAIRSGSFDVVSKFGESAQHASAGDFVLVDCYAHHSYSTSEDSDVLWLHFDGPTARAYYELIHERLGSVFSLREPGYAITQLTKIYETFHMAARISEPLMAKYITDVLTEFALGADDAASAPVGAAGSGAARGGSATLAGGGASGLAARRGPHAIESVLAYIANHLNEPLTVRELAGLVYMSEYHFIRVFKKETGYTPYAYVLDARMHAAKYRLINSDISLRQLCEECGFTDTSSFCAAFKRKNGVSPMEFRKQSEIRRS
ncbi:AraC family transcriptional regulator [Bifidobacterium felsineum]|uniref:AraC family transcriptional regulator n=1 Tax=Bifidobacterium felsineum TaxID=2045440 RepID=A0A2M9HI86_9BIFI|nr:AraC family transcriptional regulator [Bifidobacterium felsineum]MBT1164356.1 helix-turn-helix transcriptional regulator [Bifidobacterium felsineum]PJM76522.1 AraC family transcriptional regulator [Bifidobacterium felsineum]